MTPDPPRSLPPAWNASAAARWYGPGDEGPAAPEGDGPQGERERLSRRVSRLVVDGVPDPDQRELELPARRRGDHELVSERRSPSRAAA